MLISFTHKIEKVGEEKEAKIEEQPFHDIKNYLWSHFFKEKDTRNVKSYVQLSL